MEEEFGLHQTFDCYHCDEKKLDDIGFIYQFLNDFPERIGMSRIAPPFVMKWPGGTKKDPGGITGFVLIAESHISIHTFSKLGFLTMDVYSCNTFDTQHVKDLVQDIFHAGEIEENLIKRGLRFRELALSKIAQST